MKRRLGWGWIVAVWLMVSTACGFGVSSPPILGQWQSVDDPSVTFEFRDNGLFALGSDGRTFTGAYEWVDGQNIEVTVEGDLGARTMYLTNLVVEGDQLTVSINEQVLVFERVDD